MLAVLVLGSSLECGKMATSKKLSTELKTKLIHCHELGEVYRKLSRRFIKFVSAVRNVVQKWKTTRTVVKKERCGGLKNILERHRQKDGHRQAADRLQKTTRTSGH